MSVRITSCKIGSGRDIARVRNHARVLAINLGFSSQDQTRIATAASEIARNAIQYANAGIVDFEIESSTVGARFLVIVKDKGPGIDDIDGIMAGNYRSRTGMGMGVAGSAKLMDSFDIDSGAEGTVVTMGKILPGSRNRNAGELAIRAAEALQENKHVEPAAELEHQNSELLYSLQELRAREELLEESNRTLKDMSEDLSKSLAESKFLLHEVHHRVKNNLQVIGSLVAMHQRSARHEETSEVLQSLGGRIRAFGFIHDQLYQYGSEGKVELNEYLSAICGSLRSAMTTQEENIEIHTDVEQIYTGFEFAQDIGVIVNELVTNSCKHAFGDSGDGRIDLKARQRKNDLILTISDNGKGLGKAEQPESPTRSMGMRILNATIRKLQGTMEVEGENGYSATITVPLPEADAPDE